MRYLATFLNFAFPGAGYLLLGHKVPMAIAWLVGVIGLAYVEQVHQFGGVTLKDHDPVAFGIMFASVFIMNTAFAVDAWKVGGSLKKDTTGLPQTA